MEDSTSSWFCSSANIQVAKCNSWLEFGNEHESVAYISFQISLHYINTKEAYPAMCIFKFVDKSKTWLHAFEKRVEEKHSLKHEMFLSNNTMQ